MGSSCGVRYFGLFDGLLARSLGADVDRVCDLSCVNRNDRLVLGPWYEI